MDLRLTCFIETVQAATNIVFQYDRKDDALRTWDW
jgi:hypothetical protein